MKAVHRSLSVERGRADYGEEIDPLANANWHKLAFLVKYADYDTKTFAPDFKKLCLEVV